MNRGRLININKDLYTITENNSVFLCTARGKIRNEKLIVGDIVEFNPEEKTIEKVLPRKNSLIRPLVSNIDKLFIVTSVHIPKFSSYLIDKFIVIALQNNIEPLIIITKEDLISKKEKKEIRNYLKYYKSLGYKVYFNNNIRKIKKEIKSSLIALAGQTGAGKSTLLNKIDKNLKLETNEVSLALGRGKHTTRMVTLHKIAGGYIADTPGFSSLEVDIPKEELKNYFIEFEYNCKYNTCNHIKENNCDVIERVNKEEIPKERYENYKKLYEEIKERH